MNDELTERLDELAFRLDDVVDKYAWLELAHARLITRVMDLENTVDQLPRTALDPQ